MKRTLASLVVILSLVMGTTTSVWAADIQKGLEAAQRGDFATALREWRPLAEQGDATAQYSLGRMYALGEGVIQDDVMAHMWANIAAANGDTNASIGRDVIAVRMNPSQLAEAQKLARECVARNYKGC
jgi:TPR repeat protein